MKASRSSNTVPSHAVYVAGAGSTSEGGGVPEEGVALPSMAAAAGLLLLRLPG